MLQLKEFAKISPMKIVKAGGSSYQKAVHELGMKYIMLNELQKR